MPRLFRPGRLLAAGIVLSLLTPGLLMPHAAAQNPPALLVSSVDAVGFTVSDMDRALAFYTGVLPFTKVRTQEVSGRQYELLSGLFGARSRIVRLRLGTEEIELTEFLAPKGRPMPADARANDRFFQHIAIVVSDMTKAYDVLRAHHVKNASTEPQRLPDWNTSAGGIRAFYFRDPDGHFLEVINFPDGKGLAKWHQPAPGAPGAPGTLFLGIDHTAIVVDNTNVSLGLYRDTLGMQIAGESENYDIEQEHLNNVFGARLRITTLRAATGPGVELLEYLAPRDGRPSPADLHANDIAHWQTTIVTNKLDALVGLARDHRIGLVSPGPVNAAALPLGFRSGALARDLDGHGLRFIER